MEDQNHSNYEEISFTLDHQYADDLGWTSASQHVLDNIEKKNCHRKTEAGKPIYKSIKN